MNVGETLVFGKSVAADGSVSINVIVALSREEENKYKLSVTEDNMLKLSEYFFNEKDALKRTKVIAEEYDLKSKIS